MLGRSLGPSGRLSPRLTPVLWPTPPRHAEEERNFHYAKLFETVCQRIVFAQIDETAFGKRKFNRGHRVRIGSTIWAWGYVCLGADGRTLNVHFEYVP